MAKVSLTAYRCTGCGRVELRVETDGYPPVCAETHSYWHEPVEAGSLATARWQIAGELTIQNPNEAG